MSSTNIFSKRARQHMQAATTCWVQQQQQSTGIFLHTPGSVPKGYLCALLLPRWCHHALRQERLGVLLLEARVVQGKVRQRQVQHSARRNPAAAAETT
jgi:hypothetical protein